MQEWIKKTNGGFAALKLIPMDGIKEFHVRHSEHQRKTRKYSRHLKCHGNFWRTWLVLGFQILLLFAMAIIIAGVIFYAVFKPRNPKFSVDNFKILTFAVGEDAAVSSQFVVSARMTNSNKKIGIYYLEDSYVRVLFSGTELCRGKFPAFYQGHETISSLQVVLTGAGVKLNNKQVTLLNAERVDGSIPLHLKADLPVKFKAGKIKTLKYTYHLHCDLVLGARTGYITKSKCKVKI